MIFSRNWLAEYVELPAEAAELADRLTAVGLAVEGREQVGDDVWLDVDVTANRPDCMAHLGLAREIAVALDGRLASPPVELPVSGDPVEDAVEAEIAPEAAEACRRYVALLIEGVRVGPSPQWLVERLRAVGVRPVNNVVDVTNYVLWETGQPLHAFDWDRIRNRTLRVRFAGRGESLVTLDGQRRELGPEVLLIADDERPVALAGIMGGADTEVTEGTANVMLESAHFHPVAVRHSASRFDLHTDASHRFERGADWRACRVAAERAAALILELAGGTPRRGVVDARSAAEPPILSGRLDLDRLDAFAGVPIPEGEPERILVGLGFACERIGGRILAASVPSWRQYDFQATDPSGEVWFADLAEEVLRHFTFDRIPSALPRVEGPDAPSAAGFERRAHLRELLVGCGYFETASYAFGTAEQAAALPSVVAGEAIELANPLSERYAVLRRSLLPGLVETALFNLRRGAAGVRLFESGHVFAAAAGGGVEERETLALIAGGAGPSPWDDGGEEPDLFALKGVVEALCAHLGVELSVEPVALPGLVPGTAARLRRAGTGEPLGHIGRIDAPGSTMALVAAELAVDTLPVHTPVEAVVAPSRFPGVEADLTLAHDERTRWSELAAAIAQLRSEQLVDFRLKSRYRGPGVPPGAVNTTITFLYQRADRSLTQEEVNSIHGALAAELEKRFGVAR